MTDTLTAHITRLTDLSADELVTVGNYFQSLQVKKKQMLLEEGKVGRTAYFVAKGCLRLFFVNEKGVDHTVQFALENWWLADFASFSTQTPSRFGIQAVERSEILAIDYADHEMMLAEVPKMERYFRLIHQRAHAAAQFRIRSLYDRSKEELYFDFAQRYPDFVQRVPQYQLASFLGFTPEYLSEIRRRKLP